MPSCVAIRRSASGSSAPRRPWPEPPISCGRATNATTAAGTRIGCRALAIPLGARIIAVCDAYAKMVTEQPYERAFSPADALDELRRGAGTQFDPAVVEIVCDLVGRHGWHAATAA